ncbi:MAG TPA: glycosyltransferase family 39 protein [bacterium]|nr:glycosyltransferase family 39 protein [bacterium]
MVKPAALRAADWLRVAVAVALGLAAFAAVLVTTPDYGLTWDEGKFLDTGERYRWWLHGVATGTFSPLAAAPLQYAWLHTWDHPPLSRLLSVVTLQLTGNRLGVIGAQRLRSVLLLAVTVATGTWWLARRYSLLAGLAGGWAMLCLPRLFGDAHLATTDMPLACFWLLTALAFHHEWEHRRRPWLTTAGLAAMLLTKHSAILILLAFVPFIAAEPRRGGKFLALALGGALLCYPLVQPQLWVEPLASLRQSLTFFVMRQNASPLPVLFFNEMFPFRAGWHYGVTMLLVTVPLAVLAPALAGLAAALRTRERAALHLAVHACLLPLVLAVPFVPTYDGVRLMLPALPFVGMLAGLGLAQWLHLPAAPWRWLLVAGWLLAAGLPLWQYAPRWHLTYYNELIGGLPGAARAGMETTYYGEALGPGELAWLNRNLPARAKVNFVCISPWTLKYLINTGQLRADLQFDNRKLSFAAARREGFDYMLVYYRWSFLHATAQAAGGGVLPPAAVKPLLQTTFLGEPMVALFAVQAGR